MTASPDIRWQQRFANYRKALARLTEAVNLRARRPLSDLDLREHIARVGQPFLSLRRSDGMKSAVPPAPTFRVFAITRNSPKSPVITRHYP